MFNITWIVVENPEDNSAPFDSSNGLENGIYIVSPTVNYVKDFQDFLAGKFSESDPPADDIERLIRCLGNTEVSDISHKDIASTIDAVFMFGTTLQRRTTLYCSEKSMCDLLRTAFEFKLSEVQSHPVKYADIDDVITVHEFSESGRTTTFADNGEFVPNADMSLYDVSFVYQNNLTKIGDFRDSSINLTDSHLNKQDEMPSSICKEECEICENIPDISFAFLDGETFILGVFAVHETDPDDPFRCSKFRTFQMDVVITETFLFSVQQMRNQTGIQFGAIVIDDCYSSAQTELVLSQILSGEVTLTNPYTEKRIEVERIAAVVMTVSSSVTIPVSFLMTEKKIPVISASASSPDLDDRINFPYFLRTVPSDVEQARAMISIIKSMGWSYVSLLYVENNYGSKGKEAFVRLANESGICIAASPEGISDVSDDNSEIELNDVFTRLTNQRAEVVVYFGTEARIEEFLKLIRNKQNNFIFLASEDWGDRQYILDIGKDRTLGSITLKNEVESLAGKPLEQHLKSLNPNNVLHSRNPWFVEYWEEKFKCDLPQTFRHKFDNVCNDTLKFSDDNITGFVEDQRIVHTVVAVQALANGLKKSQMEFCNPNLPQGNTFPCQKYFQYITDVVRYIREIEISRGGSDARVFKDDGNGNVGFRVNNVQKTANSELDYTSVGSYAEGKLELDDNKLNFYQTVNGDCFGSYCGHCTNGSFTKPVTIATTTHTHPQTDDFAIPDYTIIGILGFLFVIIMIMSIIIICYFKRRIVELESQLKETKYEIRTGYALHNNSTFSHANTASITYPEMKFVNPGPSGESMYEWRKAQNVLNGGNSKYSKSNGGIVNQGFVGDMYLQPTHDEDENQHSSSSGNFTGSPRGHVTNSEQINSLADSPVYKPPSTSYGLSSHSSFKKPSDYNHNGQIKKQPRTQLAVPPCRPELPPRDSEQQRAHAQRPNGFTDKFDHMSPAVPKEKVRKVRSSPRRTVSPPSFKHSPEHSRYRDSDIVDSSKYNGKPPNMTYPDSAIASPNMVNLEGSMEKISRV